MNENRTLEGLLRSTLPNSEFRISVQNFDHPEGIHIIVHAVGEDSDTVDFVVSGNEIAEYSVSGTIG